MVLPIILLMSVVFQNCPVFTVLRLCMFWKIALSWHTFFFPPIICLFSLFKVLGTRSILHSFSYHSKIFVTVLNSLTFYSWFLRAYLGVDLSFIFLRLCFWAPSQPCTQSCWSSLTSEKWPTWYRTPWAVCPQSCTWTTPCRLSNFSALAKPWKASSIPTQVRRWVSWMKQCP